METNSLNKAHEQIIAKIDALDLAAIKFKLMDAEEGHGWTREYADRIEIEYKRFLTLLVKHPEASIAPSKAVDKFWHGHILDTMKYAEDCHQVFGYFLHHFPYFGMRGSDDAANLAAAADTTNRLYRQEFGDAQPAKESSYCGATSAVSYCGVAAGETTDTALLEASYCGATVAVSYCGAASEKEIQAKSGLSSYCGAATGVSYCGAATTASYCGAATSRGSRNGMSRENILKTNLRPTLPPAAAK